MLHVGLDLSRTRLDVHAMDETGAPIAVTTAAPDAGGLASLAYRLAEFGQPVTAAIESMTGARFVHDQLNLRGWAVEIADAVKVKGFAPLACKTDRIDAWVLAELSRRDLVPAIWLPTPGVRADRERARWRLHLVRHRPRRSARPPGRPHGWPSSTAGAGPTAPGPGSPSGKPIRPPARFTPDRRLPRRCGRRICWSSTRPACSTRTPAGRCSPSPTRPRPESHWSVTTASSRRSAAAECSTSPSAPPSRPPACPWTRCTASPAPTQPAAPCPTPSTPS
jgi:hypothetical protein